MKILSLFIVLLSLLSGSNLSSQVVDRGEWKYGMDFGMGIDWNKDKALVFPVGVFA